MFRIAIDGPGGAGKSSVAKKIAKEMGIIYVDTGALYRAIGYHVLSKGISPKDAPAVVAELKDIHIELKFTDRQILLLNGNDIGDFIRTPEVSMAASAVSAIPEVRQSLLALQQDIAAKNSVIMDGRDIGTVIIPDAELKVFLTATPEARARRRYEELKARGDEQVTYEKVLSEMNERDRNDSTREVSPCVPASDAFTLDNSHLDLEGTAKKIEDLVKIRKAEIKSDKKYKRMYAWMAPLVRFFLHIHVTGKENIPKEGGYLVCSNHIAVRDVFVVASAMRRPIHFIAKKELFSVPLVGTMIKSLGAVSVDRTGNDIGAVKTSIELAKRGNPVAIFPQGHRMPGVNPAETKPQNGAAMIAYRAGCDVLPVCIKVKNVKYGFLRRVDLVIGKPISYEELGFQNGGTLEYQKATERIFGDIIRLGNYSALPAPGEQ